MIDSELYEEINSTYIEHENINAMLSDLRQGINFNEWADRFTTDAYYNNLDLAQALFEESMKHVQTWRDYRDLAFYVGKPNGYNDTVWAKNLIEVAITQITILRDLRSLADDLATKSSKFYDRVMAMEIFKEVIEKSQSAYDFYCVAESLCNKDMIDDKDWAIEVYKKGIEVCKNTDELTALADSIADEDGLNDEVWSEELYEIAEEFQKTTV